MNRRLLLKRLRQGAVRNVSFSDLVNLLKGFGFRELRIRGSHHVHSHPFVPRVVPLQPQHGQAKSYQIREILRLIDRYNLRLEDES